MTDSPALDVEATSPMDPAVSQDPFGYYAALRARFGAGPRAALAAALFMWLFVLLLWINFVNLGVFPWEIVGLSLLFNLFEIPGAAIAGASVYREKPA